MAKIQNVDYKDIPNKTKQMRTYAQDINSELVKAYTTVKNMSNDWYGQRYNDLVNQFNKLIPQIDDLLILIVSELPDALDTIANNYAQADTGAKIATGSKATPKKIAAISKSSKSGMRFITSSVQSNQASVSKNFENAVDKMNKYGDVFKKINWTSEAQSAFQSKFNTLKNNVTNSFNEINSSFKKLMAQTANDIQSAESNNTVN